MGGLNFNVTLRKMSASNERLQARIAERKRIGQSYGPHGNSKYTGGTGPGSEYQRLGQAASRERIRMSVYAAYGSECTCCGERNTAFLTVDHVNEDGAAHRAGELKGGTICMYRWLVKNNFPPNFQLLCFNCNCARSMRGGGACPHKTPVDPRAARNAFAALKAERLIANPRKVSPTMTQGIFEMKSEGFSQRDIAAYFRIDQSTVSRALRHNPQRQKQ